MRRLHLVGLLGPLGIALVGCVPYSVHQETKNELEKARAANDDLVRKYNQAMEKLATKDAELAGRDPAPLLVRLKELESDNEKLKKELASSTAFSKDDAAKLPGAGLDAWGGIQIGAALLFAEGSNVLRPEATQLLDKVAELLKGKYRDDMIILEGHTDNQELHRTRGKWQYNMRLGYERAHAVFEHLIAAGIPENRMLIRAFSYNMPTDPAKQNTEEGRRENRRVVVRRGGAKI